MGRRQSPQTPSPGQAQGQGRRRQGPGPAEEDGAAHQQDQSILVVDEGWREAAADTELVGKRQSAEGGDRPWKRPGATRNSTGPRRRAPPTPRYPTECRRRFDCLLEYPPARRS